MLDRLDQAIKTVCPIDGLSGDRNGVRIDFRPEATDEQRAAAKDVLKSFDWDAPEPVSLWPYEFQGLLTDDQLVAIQLSTEPLLIRLRTKVQTIVSPMPFGEGSQLYQAVQLLGMVMPELFTPEEVSRILACQPPE